MSKMQPSPSPPSFPSRQLSDTDVVPVYSSARSVGSSFHPLDKTYMTSQKRIQWATRYIQRLRLPSELTPYAHHPRGDEDDDSTDEEQRSPYHLLQDETMTDYERFTKLPRPSQIVPDVHLGHRHDAGISKTDRQAHVRRITATYLRVHNYNSNGLLMIISSTTRQHHSLDLYSPYLLPPQTDLHVRPTRVPKPLLSRHYRGKTLVRRFSRHFKLKKIPKFHGIPQSHEKKKRRSSKKSLEADKRHPDNIDNQDIDFETCAEESNSAGDINDYEYWCPSPVFEEEERNRISFRKALSAQKVKDEATKRARDALGVPSEPHSKRHKSYASGDSLSMKAMSNSEIVRDIIEEELRSDSEDGAPIAVSEEDDDKDYSLQRSPQSPSTRKSNRHTGQVILDDEDDFTFPSPASPKLNNSRIGDLPIKKKVEAPLFDDLLKMLQTDPLSIVNTSVPKTAKDEPEKHCNSELEDAKNDRLHDGEHVGRKPKEEMPDLAPPKHLNPFEREKWLALQFSKSISKRDCISWSSLMKTVEASLKRQKSYQQTGGVGINKEEEEEEEAGTMSRAWDMMKRMGFKDRLGLNEDGIAEPLPLSQRLMNSKEGVGLGFNRRFNLKNVQNGTKAPVRTGPSPAEDDAKQGAMASKSLKIVAIEQDAVGATKRKSRATKQDNLHKKVEDVVDLTLNLDDVYETEVENKIRDNGRRGIVIDFDLLIENARDRRRKAFKDLMSFGLREVGNVDILSLIEDSERDVYDVDVVKKLFEINRIKTNDAKIKSMMEALNTAYESVDMEIPPLVNIKVLKMLVQWSRRNGVRFGIMHRGSVQRLRTEGKKIGISNVMKDVCYATVGMHDEWPYIESMRLLLCQVGVQPAQCVMLSSSPIEDTCKGRRELSGVYVAGHVIGARCVMIRESDGQSNGTGKHGCLEMGTEEIETKGVELFENIMKQIWTKRKRKRVLVLRDMDQQFHCGVVEFGDENACLDKLLVRFYIDGRCEWTSTATLTAIDRKSYRILRNNDFPAMLAPEDVDAFDV